MNDFFDGSAPCDCTGKYIIGRRAAVKFLDDLDGIEVVTKIDTGAYTGALHVEDIHEENGKLKFRPVSASNDLVEVSNYRIKKVKSSNGIVQERFVVYLTALVNGHQTELELTLASRSEMKYEMLLGRKNLKDKFIVDVSL